ncbi:MAG: DUF3379 family protein [Sedimenticola sp.]
MMQCTELQELFTADPRCREPEALQHLDGCSDCAEWLTELQSFEMELSSAMEVEIPPGLEQRILNRQKQQPKGHVTPLFPAITPHNWLLGLSAAASLLLVFGLITSLNYQQPVEQQMISWLSTQQPAQYRDKRAPDAEVEGMFREVGAELVADIGTIHHCHVTQVGGEKIGYFVVSGEGGLVSVVVVAGDGKKIIIQGKEGSDNSTTEKRIKAAIKWI